MLMLRSSPGGMAICQSWVERMQQEMVSIARLPAGMLQWWSNDQTFFNEVVHRATLMHTLKDPMPEGRTAAAEYMRGSTRTPMQLDHRGLWVPHGCHGIKTKTSPASRAS